MGENPGVPLPTSPPNCPQCGKPMAAGQLRGQSVGLEPADVVWVSNATGNIYPLTRAGSFRWSASPPLPGFVCADCGIAQVRFNPRLNAS